MGPRPRAPLEGDSDADVVVLGAGLTGCAAALEAAFRGQRVVVLEAAGVGSGATAAAVGHIPTGLEIPYTLAVERHGREGAREIWEAQRENHERVVECLGVVGDDCGYSRCGGFRMAGDREEALMLAESEDVLREDGFSGEFFDHHMLEARFDVRGFAAAYWAADDGEIEASRFVRALAGAAEQRGAQVHEASPVLDVDLGPHGVEAVTARGRVRAPLAILALEAATPRHVPFLAGRLRIVEGRCRLLELDPAAALPSPARSPSGSVLWRQTQKGLMLADFGEPLDLGPFLARTVPAAATRVARPRTASAAVSADGLPFIGPLPGLPAAVACGYGSLGWAWAPLAARWAVEALLTGHDPTPARLRAGRDVGAGGV